MSVLNFLRQAMAARKGIADLSVLEVRMALIDWTRRLGMDDRFVQRYLNEGFSGGEKKRNEILQMALLEPDVAVLDETDSGLDIDALRRSSRTASTRCARTRPALGVLLITHYRRILEHLTPDRGAHLDPRPDRRLGRLRARRPGRAGGLRRDPPRSRSGRVMSAAPLDVARVQADFPILKRQVHGQRLVYLDSASSSQKPTPVLDAMDHLYRESYANVHRGVYAIAEEATAAYEGARARLASFLGAPSPSELVFTRNVTEAINLVARSWGHANLREGDVVVLTDLEHHANIVPWHILAAERGIELRWVPLTEDHRLDVSNLDELLDGAKLFAFSADVERARDAQRRRVPRRRGARGRRARAGRRRPVRPPPAHST